VDFSHQRRFFLLGAILGSVFLIVQVPQALAPLRTTASPETYLIRLSLLLFLFCLPIGAGWFGARLVGGIVFSLIGASVALFSWAVSRSDLFGWFVPGYGFLCLILYRIDQRFEDRTSLARVELEKAVNEKNDLEADYRHKGESVSIFFEKYSTYYNLRKLAEDFAARLSLPDLSQLVVSRSLEFVMKGDGCFLTLASATEEKLSLVASKRLKETTRARRKEGDLFDFWVIRNRKRLLITDTQKDVRFDMRHLGEQGEEIRSLISAPLLHEGRVLGTLRLHSAAPESFTADDLRLLDAISTLASAALSNAMLFEKTQELAIRDSLTGLYVQRYFFERLREEHRRVLRSGHPLSLLMCDLDHFKAANDRWGHGAGDLMLIRFSEILKEKAEEGVVARYGGEEFAVLLPECPKGRALELAEEVRGAMEQFPFTIRREQVKMTVSIGVANIPADTLDDEELIRKSDEALYRAKREGRNRVAGWRPA
jgi:diguanylate cyclase (GGDEF)-like protein